MYTISVEQAKEVAQSGLEFIIKQAKKKETFTGKQKRLPHRYYHPMWKSLQYYPIRVMFDYELLLVTDTTGNVLLDTVIKGKSMLGTMECGNNEIRQ